jgi:cytochrome c peroxidase
MGKWPSFAWINAGVLLLLSSCSDVPTRVPSSLEETLKPIELLGKAIFFDESLSARSNQSCATCHDPEVGWTGPDGTLNGGGSVYEGSIPWQFGNRKPPSSAYATLSPVFQQKVEEGETLFVGGNFWDGRATGERLGNPAADQAQGPFLNPLEQAFADEACVVFRVCGASYPISLTEVWGAESCEIPWPDDAETICGIQGGTLELTPQDRHRVELAFDQIARSLAAYEASPESNAFTSKFDAFLRGEVELNDEEALGLALFESKGMCDRCHPSAVGPDGEPPLFTDFTYDNLGFPRNWANPFYRMPASVNPDGEDWVDEGLGGFLGSRQEFAHLAHENHGKHRVPTLRNVDKRPNDGFLKAYGHNGYFKSLEDVIHFYNTRDILPECSELVAGTAGEDCWPSPEVRENVNREELGNLGLTEEEEEALVAFLKTLTDEAF